MLSSPAGLFEAHGDHDRRRDVRAARRAVGGRILHPSAMWQTVLVAERPHAAHVGALVVRRSRV